MSIKTEGKVDFGGGEMSIKTEGKVDFKSMNIYEKIHYIQSNVKGINKGGTNTFGQGYTYSTEQDILNELKPLLAEARLVCFPGYTEFEHNGLFSWVKGTFTIVNIDKPDEMVVIPMFGESNDGSSKTGVRSDKGLWKAYTGMQKYGFAKAFNLSFGNDEPEDPKGENERNEKPENPKVEKTGTMTHNPQIRSVEFVKGKINECNHPDKLSPLITWLDKIAGNYTDDENLSFWSLFDVRKKLIEAKNN